MTTAAPLTFVTGAASGIGLACAARLLDDGHAVGASDLAASDALAALIDRHPGRAAFAAADVTDENAVADAHARLVQALGAPTGLVCAAGVLSGKTLLDTPMALWRRTFAVNVEGSVHWMQRALPAMAARKDGAVVLFSSQLTVSGARGNAAYVAAKGALRALARTAALEHADDNIRINAILPGAIDTPMLRRGATRFADPDAALERSRRRHALQRFGTADEIAGCIAFLLSPAAGFMTGAELVCDGGWSIA